MCWSSNKLNIQFKYLLHLSSCKTNNIYIRFLLTLFSAFVTHLATQAGVKWPPGPFWFCTFVCTMNFFGFLCSTLLVVSMTFDRFYNILMPLQAASFNTVKRAKITILCIYLFSLAYNIPQAFLVDGKTYQCVPYGKVDQIPYSMVYYWTSFVINYALPFILLLSMNSVIIHKIRLRQFGNSLDEGPSESQGQIQPRRNSEGQTFAILLLVTFALLILTTPAYIFFIYIQVIDFTASPESFASYFLFYHSSFALQVTNYGINFFLYVISGKKFRTDLMKLFQRKHVPNENLISRPTESSSLKS